MIMKSVYTDMCFQAIGGIDPEFDSVVKTVSHIGQTVTVVTDYDPSLVDELVALPAFMSRNLNPRSKVDTFYFKIDAAWERILDMVEVSDDLTHDTQKYQWDKVVYFVQGNNNPRALEYAKMIMETVNGA